MSSGTEFSGAPGPAFASLPLPRTRPTLRGWGLLAVAAFAVAMAWAFGPRSLNALVTPLLVVFLVGAISVLRTDRPRVARTAVEAGFAGDRRTVEFTADAADPVSATVRDRVGDGLSAIPEAGIDVADDAVVVADATIGDGSQFRYEIRLEERGERVVGPPSIVVTDLLGLVKRRFEYDESETASVLVYPDVHELGGDGRRELSDLAAAAGAGDREEFDHLREYRRGDSLRDVHWKSAAKRLDDDLVVKEFAADDSLGSATVVGECADGYEDEMAAAVASVAAFLLEAGVDVGVTVPDGARPAGSGEAHRHRVFSLLAVAGPGRIDDRDHAREDVLVRADGEGTVVTVGERVVPFERLRTRSRSATATRTRAGSGDRNRARGVFADR
ncbi:DUF58 domain-containing protein [Natrialbaceae archaeon GCM10025810]|uniref:DUF58 domain-containing protein n=1 Tax=Halovalidus salilacus TaxID=3075124 RepID=UPI00361B3A01